MGGGGGIASKDSDLDLSSTVNIESNVAGLRFDRSDPEDEEVFATSSFTFNAMATDAYDSKTFLDKTCHQEESCEHGGVGGGVLMLLR